ncbi:MAG: hypothetical protein AAB567_02855 [Patescibacteria group bacterium]
MRTYGEITKCILFALAAVGAIPVLAVAPGLGYALRPFLNELNLPNEVKERRKVSQALYRLKQSRLIIVNEQMDGKFLVELTEAGKRKMREFEIEKLTVPIPKKWDGLWRILIFDIPNKKSGIREVFRMKLKELGFYQLQKSVWVLPYPCDAQVEFLVEFYRVRPYTNIIRAKEIKNDVLLKKHFKLF